MSYPLVQVEDGTLADNKYKDGNKVWYVSNLIERSKSLPVFEIPLCAIFVGQNIWDGNIDSAIELAKHIKRVNSACLDYPIIMDSEGFVMDGWHRITKALLEGVEKIKAVRFEVTPAADYYE